MSTLAISFFATAAAQPSEPATGSSALLVGCLFLAMIALAGVAGVFGQRRQSRQVSRQARVQHDAMQELLRTVRMAESIAGIGIWQYVPETGDQRWSDGLKRLFGIESDAPLIEGDAEAMLYANGTDLVGMVEGHFEDLQPYLLQLDIVGCDAVPRTISLHACNMRNEDGTVQRVVAVVRDITDDVLRAREAERQKQLGLLAGGKDGDADEDDASSQTDPLTGLSTRRAVMQQLDGLVIQARQSNDPLAVVMFDIDHFKRVNDRHGRSEGDLLLQKVARVVREQARVVDPIGRIDGEEFVWIIPGANEGMARVMTERMRIAVAKGSAVGAIGPVTISLGFAVIQDGDTPLSLFARADQALYEAMNSGRNRVRAAA